MVITFYKYKLVLTSKSMWIGPGYFTTTITKSSWHHHWPFSQFPLSPLSTKMVITVAVVHTEETPCIKKLASTWIFWYLSRNSSWCFFFLSADYFLQKSEHSYWITFVPAEWQTGWIQIRPDILSNLIWLQTVCIGCQQMTLVETEILKI